MKNHNNNEFPTNWTEEDTFVQSEGSPVNEPVNNDISKKQQLHELDVSIVQLKNAQARRATLAAEIKKAEKAARKVTYSRVALPVCILAVLFLVTSVILGFLYLRTSKDLSTANSSIAELNYQLGNTHATLLYAVGECDTLNNSYSELETKYNHFILSVIAGETPEISDADKQNALAKKSRFD